MDWCSCRLRLTSADLPQLVATFRREGEILRSVAILSGAFMALRDADGADSPADADPTLRTLIRTKSGPNGFVSLDGEALSRLSAAAGKRVLTLLLGESRRVRTLPSQSALGLVTFLQLSGLPNLVRCTPRQSLRSCARRPPGCQHRFDHTGTQQPGRVEAWGEGRAEELLTTYVRRWEGFGRPTLHEVQLTIHFGPKEREASNSWRQLCGADSIVQIDWS